MNYKKQEKELSNLISEMLCKPDYIFYGLFLTEINKSFNYLVPTACISKHINANLPSMNFNPDFWDKLNKNQRRFLLIHELNVRLFIQ